VTSRRLVLSCMAWLSVMVGCSEASDEPRLRRSGQELGSERAIWRTLPVVGQAVARTAHVFVFDSAQNRHVIFGGRAPDDDGASLEDAWLLDADASFRAISGYARRGYVAGAFDSTRMVTVVFGGVDVERLRGIEYKADTWELAGAMWNQVATATSPPERCSYGSTYDAARGSTVLFGGYDGTWKDDLWLYDGSDWHQACTSADCQTQPRPAGRARPVFVYDQARRVSVLFGGSADGRAFNDTWTWDGERWTLLDPVDVPPPRDAAAATYDPITKRVLLFGGASEATRQLGDLWAWDGSNWASIEASGKPVAREGAGMAWDPTCRCATLFAGAARGTATDAWRLQLTGNSCAVSEDCHFGACVDGACRDDGSGPGPSYGGSDGTGGAEAIGAGGSTEVIAGADGVEGKERETATDERSLYSCALVAPAGESSLSGAAGWLVVVLLRRKRAGATERRATAQTRRA
jgi:hypothetical protein